MKYRIQHQINTIKHAFFQLDNGQFNDLICSDRLTELVSVSGNDRDKIFTPLVTLNAFLWQVLSENGCCKEAVGRIFSDRLQRQQSPNSFNTGPCCKARQRLSLSWIIREVRQIGMALHNRADKAWMWRGFNVVLVDGMTVLMPDTPANQIAYPQQSVQKPGLGFPVARLVAPPQPL